MQFLFLGWILLVYFSYFLDLLFWRSAYNILFNPYILGPSSSSVSLRTNSSVFCWNNFPVKLFFTISLYSWRIIPVVFIYTLLFVLRLKVFNSWLLNSFYLHLLNICSKSMFKISLKPRVLFNLILYNSFFIIILLNISVCKSIIFLSIICSIFSNSHSVIKPLCWDILRWSSIC